jgi:glycosyltransferase involved in cell wall biosynthesis
MPFSILLLTPGQPSSNPRLVKEAIALASKGYSVTVLYCHWVNWADKGDEELQKQYPHIRWIRVGGHPVSQKGLYWFTRIRHKVYRLCAGIFPDNLYFVQRAYIRCYNELKRTSTAHPAQLYIAHNLGALAPAALAAKRNHSLYAFDAEDYHRGQSAADDAESKSTKIIEDHYLPGAAYLTAASPLIAATYKQHYPQVNPIVLNNVFSLEYLQPQPIPYHSGDRLKLFWFSQSAGSGRGLENVIEAMGKMRSRNVSLTILANCSADIKNYFTSLAQAHHLQEEQLQFMEPVLLKDIFVIAGQHHVGLATEMGLNTNYNIALTNKIFSYPLSGLAILATDTPAQELFLKENPGIGRIYKRGDITELVESIEWWLNNPAELNQCRESAHRLARESLNWEKEQEIFLQTINAVLS